MKVLAAMSGGVDSAVAAARAVEAGHDVTGVHMALTRVRAQFREGSRGCCSIEDALDARRAADILGIPFYVWDLSTTFEDRVIADFLSEYAAGRTPNPCVRCNEHIKFDTLLERGRALGYDAVVTGHYARVITGPEGVELHRGANQAKDQSYVLAVMGPERLAGAMFPLGDTVTKADVRAEAAERGLRVADKPDSYDICFIPDGDTAGFLTEQLGGAGEVVDTAGRVLATHSGTHGFTIGQRKGLGIGSPAPDGRPRYVLEIQPVSRTVVVGGAADLTVSSVTADQIVWFVEPSSVGSADLQFRAHGRTVPVSVSVSGDVMTLVPDGPLSAVAAGQSAVLYDGTKVLAQATISGEFAMISSVGLWPGAVQFDAQAQVMDLVSASPSPATPWLVHLSARYPDCLVGRAAAMMGLPMEIGPHGWRMTSLMGHDQREVRTRLAEDVETLGIVAHGWTGPLVVPVPGPFLVGTAAYWQTSDLIVADAGAVIAVGEWLGEGLTELTQSIREVLPGAEVFPVVIEPAIGPALTGSVPTFTGRGTYRALDRSVALAALSPMLEVGGVVYLGATYRAAALAREAGASGVGFAAGALDERGWERVAELVESDGSVWLDLAGDVGAPVPSERELAGSLTPLRRLGLSAEQVSTVTLAGGPALRGASPDWAATFVRRLSDAAEILADQ